MPILKKRIPKLNFNSVVDKDSNDPQFHDPANAANSEAIYHKHIPKPQFDSAVDKGGYGPQLYNPASVASAIIYWPKNYQISNAESDSMPKPSAGIEQCIKRFPHGGTILSVHEPASAQTWLENNYDLDSLEEIRKGGRFSGPLPTMLSPETPALALYGPHRGEEMAKLAQRLATRSNFPVIIRPAADDPILSFKSMLGMDPMQKFNESFAAEPVIVMSAQVAEANSEPLLHPGERSQLTPQPDPEPQQQISQDINLVVSDGVMIAHPELGGAPGGGEPGGTGPEGAVNADKWADWVSPHHFTKLTIRFKIDNVSPASLEIASSTKFKTYADEDETEHRDPTEPLAERPQARVYTELTILPREQVVLDRSFAVLGFLAHRPWSIFKSSNLETGFSHPTQTHKRSIAKNSQNTFGGSVGVAGATPAPTGLVTYTHVNGETRLEESTDNKPMPPVNVKYDPGEHYDNEDQKSYNSFNYSYAANRDVQFQETSQLCVSFAFGVNFFPHDAQCNLLRSRASTAIKYSFGFQTPACGPRYEDLFCCSVLAAVLQKTVWPDIRRDSPISRQETFALNLKSGEVSDWETGHGKGADTDFSVGVVPTILKDKPKFEHANDRSTLQKVKARAKNVLRKRKPAPPQALTTHEVVSCGWDATKREWRNPIYPELDKYLQRADDPSKLVKYNISPFPQKLV
ncbi:hypothetical protein GYMLUDRAFT_82233 [Collybiopsis luxurians FD-317 M1]|nr:hypothetical protein GYMLUDRAFT_82233 [Collybiopsis luxurians FD-317 M1]